VQTQCPPSRHDAFELEKSQDSDGAEASESSVERVRADWQQRLIAVEKGLTSSWRTNSALFVYFFAASVLISVGVVVNLSASDWSILGFGMLLILFGELIYHSLGVIAAKLKESQDLAISRSLDVILGAFMFLQIGSFLIMLSLLGYRIVMLEWF